MMNKRLTTPLVLAGCLAAVIGIEILGRSEMHRKPAGTQMRAQFLALSGTPLPSFFEGLPVEARFAHGQNAFGPPRARPTCRATAPASFWTRLGSVLALTGTVHAQGTCSGNYEQSFQDICSGFCPGADYYSQVQGGSDCGTGWVYTDNYGCSQGGCAYTEYSTCSNPCGGDGGYDGSDDGCGGCGNGCGQDGYDGSCE